MLICGKRTGFTIVELMILLGIIGILVMIATPYYIKYAKAARKSACITNMKKIEGAVMLAKMSGVAAPTSADIVGPTSHLKEMPTCPSSSLPYVILDPPTCPSGDATHVMPPEG